MNHEQWWAKWRLSTFDLYPWGEGHEVQGQKCDILRSQLAMNRFLPHWPHRFPHFGYIYLGGSGRGGALILGRCRAFDLFASVDAHLWSWVLYIRGASKIKLKKVNRKRMVTVRRVIIFMKISRHSLLISLHCCLHQYKTLKAVAKVTAAIVVLTPAKNSNKVFGGFLVASPLFNHFLGYVQIYQRVIWPQKNWFQNLWEALNRR